MTVEPTGVDIAAVIAGTVSIIAMLLAGREGTREGNSIANEVIAEKAVHAIGAGVVDRETARSIMTALNTIVDRLERLTEVTEAKGDQERAQHLREDLKGDMGLIMRQLIENHRSILDRSGGE